MHHLAKISSVGVKTAHGRAGDYQKVALCVSPKKTILRFPRKSPIIDVQRNTKELLHLLDWTGEGRVRSIDPYSCQCRSVAFKIVAEQNRGFGPTVTKTMFMKTTFHMARKQLFRADICIPLARGARPQTPPPSGSHLPLNPWATSWATMLPHTSWHQLQDRPARQADGLSSQT